MSFKPFKNPLSISLTESVVFLKNLDGRHRPNQLHSDAAPSSLLRGLLILHISKPTRISSIEISLVGKVMTSWPEGAGARRIEVAREHKIFEASTVFFSAGSASSSRRRAASVGPGLGLAVYHDDDHLQTPRNDGREHPEFPPHLTRRISADNAVFPPDFVTSQREDRYTSLPTPPHTPPSEPPTPSGNSANVVPPSPRHEETPAQTLEEFRNALRAGLERERRSPSYPRNRSSQSPLNASSTSSISSIREASLSRQPSIDDVPEDEPTTPEQRTSRSPPPSPRVRVDRSRGRKSARFSFAAVSNVLIDAVKDQVRSISPAARAGRSRGRTMSREREQDHSAPPPRGRTMELRKDKGPQEHKAFARFGEILKLDSQEKEAGDGWKEFKKGVYTYPISFMIPGNVPPTMDCPYGHVTWRLKAQVHRPGTFIQKLSASQEVILIASPGEDDTEDTENIIIERQWDMQLQYLISVSGRSFYIGGTLPIQITILPMTKAKVHRISVILEERTDYFTDTKRVARTDPIQRFPLLSLKLDAEDGGPILPLASDDPDVFKRSPFYAMLTADDDPSEMASNLMGPGPWMFQRELALPPSCSDIHFSNKNRKANILISHTLKVIFRVERGDDKYVDQRTGRRKLFDIVVQTPVHILSCRCNPEWTSLPRYSRILSNESAATPPSCPCEDEHPKPPSPTEMHARGVFNGLDHISSRKSTDSVSTVESSPINRSTMPSLWHRDSLYDRSTQFERLVSGQESEIGEAPPAYNAVAGPATVR